MDVNELSESSLRVYVKLLESDRPLGVRELEMLANMVHYCLKRLEELRFVEGREQVQGLEGSH